MSRRPLLYGMMAEFTDPTELVTAIKQARAEGYRQMDAYTPYPIEEVSEALEIHHSRLPFLVLIGGIIGLCAGYGLQYWTAAVDYPLNVGGRPTHSPISFLPVTFETTVLVAALFAVLGMLALNGLPTPYHPVFNVPRFALASRDQFFLCIEAIDPQFDPDITWRFLERLEPQSIAEVPH